MPVDVLDDLHHAVFGDGLLLIVSQDAHVSLYAVAGGRARPLVTRSDDLHAWAALDELDLASPQTERRVGSAAAP